MEMMTLTGFGEPEKIFLAMITGLVLAAYLIARFGMSQGKSFWQIFFLSLIAGPVVGAIIAVLPGVGTAIPTTTASLRP